MSGTVLSTLSRAGANREVELALAVMCAITPPGVTWSMRDIAEITGMSYGGAWTVEHRALRKLRKRLRYTGDRILGRELT